MRNVIKCRACVLHNLFANGIAYNEFEENLSGLGIFGLLSGEKICVHGALFELKLTVMTPSDVDKSSLALFWMLLMTSRGGNLTR